MDWMDFAMGFLSGVGFGVVAVAIPAIGQADRLRETIMKLQVDLKYAVRRNSNDH